MNYLSKVRAVLVKSSQENISNTDIAMINAASYKDNISALSNKKLEKRILKNANLTDACFKEIENLELELDSFEKDNQALIKAYPDCYINCCNLFETIRDKQCYCITF